MTDNKRLAIAWASPVAMLLLGIGGANLGGNTELPKAAAVTEAHENFQANVKVEDAEVPSTNEKTTSLRPTLDAEPSAVKPSIEDDTVLTTETPSETSAVDALPESPEPEPKDVVQTEPVQEVTSTPEFGSEDVSSESGPVDDSTAVSTLENQTEDLAVASSDADLPDADLPDADLADAELADADPPVAAAENADLVDTLDATVPPAPSEETILEADAVDELATTSVEPIEATTSVVEPTEESAATLAVDEVENQVTEDAIVVTLPPEIETDPANDTEPASDTVTALTDADAAESGKLPTIEKSSVEESIFEDVTETASPETVNETASQTEAPSQPLEPAEPSESSNSATSSTSVQDFEEVAQPLAKAAQPPSKSSAKPFLGVGIRNPSNNIVTTIYGGSTAQKLGIMLGDKLLSVNGKSVTDVQTLRTALSGYSVDDTATVGIERNGLKYSLGPQPLGTR